AAILSPPHYPEHATFRAGSRRMDRPPQVTVPIFVCDTSVSENPQMRCSAGHEAVDASALASRKSAPAPRCKPYSLNGTAFAGIAAIRARASGSCHWAHKGRTGQCPALPVILLGFDDLQTGQGAFRVNRAGRCAADPDAADQRVADLDRQAARLDNEARIHVAHAVIGWLRSDELRKLARVAAQCGCRKCLSFGTIAGMRAGKIGLEKNLGCP